MLLEYVVLRPLGPAAQLCRQARPQRVGEPVLPLKTTGVTAEKALCAASRTLRISAVSPASRTSCLLRRTVSHADTPVHMPTALKSRLAHCTIQFMA
ncbi:MAG: hypothetical protein JWL97_3583 [Gemmatimonadales bacterium]|nr:hypothetical protein [Gemmatimonadales bacterium]